MSASRLACPCLKRISRLAVVVFGLAALLMLQPAAHADVVPGEAIIAVKPGVSEATLASTLAPYGELLEFNAPLRLARLRLRPGLVTAQAQSDLSTSPGVSFATPNHIVSITADPPASRPNDTGYISQYAPQQIHADQAWTIWRPKTTVVIAIVDTGVDNTHPDLTNKILRDGNGIVGYDAFLNNGAGARADANDGHGHGTHVAGIAAAQTNNGAGIAGIAGWDGVPGNTYTDNVKIMPIRSLDSNGFGTEMSVANGIQWAADHGANIINLSLGQSDSSSTMDAAVQYAWNKGALLVAAAGNTGTLSPFYPGASNNVISVAATDRTDTVTSYSNYGSWVSVAAPGDVIYSTFLQGQGGYAAFSGTSQAAPHVAGEAALLLCANPTLTNSQLTTLIKANVDPLAAGRAIAPSSGRINVVHALQAALGTNTQAQTTLRIDCGASTSYTTAAGVTFSPDIYASNGSVWNWGFQITAQDAGLYQTVRYDPVVFSYALPAVAGNYTLKLYFLDDPATAPGQRVFDVSANGASLLTGFDVNGTAGAGKPIIKSFPVTSDGSNVKVTFTARKGNAMVSAIELLPASTTPPPPAAPTGVTATAGNAQVTLNWTIVASADSYNVKRSATSGGPYTTIASLSTTNFVDTTVTNSQTYYYVVTAVNAGGESVPSSEVAARPNIPFTPIRMRCGSSADFVTSAGVTFTKDAYFVGGGSWNWFPLAGTLDSGLYQWCRCGFSKFDYNLPAPAGNYTLKLYFVEGVGSYITLPGMRTFNILANNSTLAANFDVVKEAGGQGIAISRSWSVTSDGSGVNLTFQAVKFGAICAAIELIPAN